MEWGEDRQALGLAGGLFVPARPVSCAVPSALFERVARATSQVFVLPCLPCAQHRSADSTRDTGLTDGIDGLVLGVKTVSRCSGEGVATEDSFFLFLLGKSTQRSMPARQNVLQISAMIERYLMIMSPSCPAALFCYCPANQGCLQGPIRTEQSKGPLETSLITERGDLVYTTHV